MSAKVKNPKFLAAGPRRRARNIFCVESLWDADIIEKLTVGPLLDLSSRLSRVDYIHLTCNTRSEFEFNLRFLRRRKSFRILYLAFHGEPGIFKLSERERITLKELGRLLHNSFPSLVVHIGSCSTLRIGEEEILSFLRLSGVAMISGYTRDIDWAESAALDLLYFSRLQAYSNLRSFIKSFERDYAGLIATTGFRAVLKA